MNQGLMKTMVAAGAITARRIVKLSAADAPVQAAAATDMLLGVSSDLSVASGERVDIQLEGIALIEAGAAYAVTARLTSDAQGRAVAAAPAAGVNNGVIGIPLEPATAAGDLCRVFLTPHSLQG